MTLGPGKYDAICTLAREQAEAEAALLLILGGNKGSGFSVQVQVQANMVLLRALPALLRDVADQIEKDSPI
jgi:hypothetical protein